MVVTYPEKVELKDLGEKAIVSGLACFWSEAFDDYCRNEGAGLVQPGEEKAERGP